MPEKEEIAILIGRAKRRLDAASHLFKEGFYEDAVSRAYYSMYFAAKALLLKRNITVKTHKGLLSKFGLKNSERRQIIQLSVKLPKRKQNP